MFDPMPPTYFITGATGFVGGHLAEACKARGLAIRTIARNSSATGLLEQMGATILRGDFGDPGLLGRALEGAEVVVHCAAKVGDWGPVEDYRAIAQRVARFERVIVECHPALIGERVLCFRDMLHGQLGVAMGPVIASIHAKRDALRETIMESGELDYKPKLRTSFAES